jgi:hypothetical protein
MQPRRKRKACRPSRDGAHLSEGSCACAWLKNPVLVPIDASTRLERIGMIGDGERHHERRTAEMAGWELNMNMDVGWCYAKSFLA